MENIRRRNNNLNHLCTITNELRNYIKLSNGRKLALWGMGNVGNALKRELLELYSYPNDTLDIECFDSKNDQYHNIEELKGKRAEYFVIVCFLKNYEKAEKLLIEFGYEEVCDFICLGKFANIIWLPDYVHHQEKLPFPRNENDDLFVIGNGPSFAEEFKKYNELISLNDCICVNAMATSGLYLEIRPKYYALADMGYYVDPALQTERMRNIVQTQLQAIVDNTAWDMILFLLDIAKENVELVQRISCNPHIKICYIHSFCLTDQCAPFALQTVISEKNRDLEYWLYNEGYARPRYTTVLILALFLGIRLQYKRIFLTGADHSWHLSLQCDEKGMYINDRHAYDLAENKTYQYAVPYGKHLFKAHEWFYETAILFKEYENMKIYAERKDIEIYNLTQNSFIDAFPKKKFSKKSDGGYDLC